MARAKKRKAISKQAKQREAQANDALWDDFYAQLIEYGHEHDTYQVPLNYEVKVDDGRTLRLGQWLHNQGKNLAMYQTKFPHWYNDIVELMETGKLWFDHGQAEAPVSPAEGLSGGGVEHSFSPDTPTEQTHPHLDTSTPDLRRSLQVQSQPDSSSDESIPDTPAKRSRTGSVSTTGNGEDVSPAYRDITRRISSGLALGSSTKSLTTPSPSKPTTTPTTKRRSAIQARVYDYSSESDGSRSESETEYRPMLTHKDKGPADRAANAPASAPKRRGRPPKNARARSPSPPSPAPSPPTPPTRRRTRTVDDEGGDDATTLPRASQSERSGRSGDRVASSKQRVSVTTRGEQSASDGDADHFPRAHGKGAPAATTRRARSDSTSDGPTHRGQKRSTAMGDDGDSIDELFADLPTDRAATPTSRAGNYQGEGHKKSSAGSSSKIIKHAESPPSALGILARSSVPPVEKTVDKRGHTPPQSSGSAFESRTTTSAATKTKAAATKHTSTGLFEKAMNAAVGNTGRSAATTPTQSSRASPSVTTRSGGKTDVTPTSAASVQSPSSKRTFQEAMLAMQASGTASRHELIVGSTSSAPSVTIIQRPEMQLKDPSQMPPRRTLCKPRPPRPEPPVVTELAVPMSHVGKDVTMVDARDPGNGTTSGRKEGAERDQLSSTMAMDRGNPEVPPTAFVPIPLPNGNATNGAPAPHSAPRRSIREDKLAAAAAAAALQPKAVQLTFGDENNWADESKVSPRPSTHSHDSEGVEMLEPADEPELVVVGGRRGGRGHVLRETPEPGPRSTVVSPAAPKDAVAAHGTAAVTSALMVWSAPDPVTAQSASAPASPDPVPVVTQPTPHSSPQKRSGVIPDGAADSTIAAHSSKSPGEKAAVFGTVDGGGTNGGGPADHAAVQEEPNLSVENAMQVEEVEEEVEVDVDPTEIVAFAYLRNEDATHPMLGIGLVCNTEEEDAEVLFLMVMVPKESDFVNTEYTLTDLDPVTVPSKMILARDLAFEHGKYGCWLGKMTTILKIVRWYSRSFYRSPRWLLRRTVQSQGECSAAGVPHSAARREFRV